MLKLKLKILLFLFLTFLLQFSGNSFSQEVNIVPYLKAIENGNIGEAQEALTELKAKSPNDPSVMFLDGVLKENGQEALVIYQKIVDVYPNSKYADASLYRIFSYYYALGLYDTAREKLVQLKTSYPASPYIQVADQNISLLGTYDQKQETPKTEEKTIPKTESYNYSIQAGAFTNLDNAKKLMNDFENAGIYTYMSDKVVGGTNFHVVYAGKFEKIEDAESFLQVLSSQYNVNGSIVTVTQK